MSNIEQQIENTTFDKIQELLNESKADQVKFYEKGNGAAGTRLRKFALDIRNLAQQARKEISEEKNK